jgi:type I restriction enzyme, S subunit
VPFLMQNESFHEHSIQQSKGSVNPYINFSDLAWYEVDLPPMEKQRGIVDLLQTLDSASDALLDLLEGQRLVELGLFTELLSLHPTEVQDLGSLLIESPRNGCSAVEASSPTGHWVLALSALTKSGYRRGEIKSVKRTGAMSAAVLKAGDLLISRSNTRDLVGLTGIFDEDRRDVSWPDTMMRLTPNESLVKRRFLELFLRTPAGRSQVQSFAAGTSASMKKINGTNVKKLSIPVPDSNVQDEIVSQTDVLRETRESTRRRLSELHELRHVILSKVLSPAGGEGA